MQSSIVAIETVIIGGGQAGLATSYWLKQQGREHLVLEKADRLPARGGSVGIPLPWSRQTGLFGCLRAIMVRAIHMATWSASRSSHASRSMSLAMRNCRCAFKAEATSVTPASQGASYVVTCSDGDHLRGCQCGDRLRLVSTSQDTDVCGQSARQHRADTLGSAIATPGRCQTAQCSWWVRDNRAHRSPRSFIRTGARFIYAWGAPDVRRAAIAGGTHGSGSAWPVS
jgi:hypothetical protein